MTDGERLNWLLQRVNELEAELAERDEKTPRLSVGEFVRALQIAYGKHTNKHVNTKFATCELCLDCMALVVELLNAK